MSEPIGIIPGADQNHKDNAINANFREIADRLEVNTLRDEQGRDRFIVGKLPYDGGFGTLYFDENGVPIMILGILPDGTTGLVIAKEGENVLDAFA